MKWNEIKGTKFYSTLLNVFHKFMILEKVEDRFNIKRINRRKLLKITTLYYNRSFIGFSNNHTWVLERDWELFIQIRVLFLERISCFRHLFESKIFYIGVQNFEWMIQTENLIKWLVYVVNKKKLKLVKHKWKVLEIWTGYWVIGALYFLNLWTQSSSQISKLDLNNLFSNTKKQPIKIGETHLLQRNVWVCKTIMKGLI